MKKYKYESLVLKAILALECVPSLSELSTYLRQVEHCNVSKSKVQYVLLALCQSGILVETGLTQPKYKISRKVFKSYEYDFEYIIKTGMAANSFMVARTPDDYLY